MTLITLNQLAARLNDIIAENKQRGRSENNDLPVVVRVKKPAPARGGRTLRHEATIPLSPFVGSCPLTLPPNDSNEGSIERCYSMTAYTGATLVYAPKKP